ncbi:MAG: bifunctional hydroxymethylpyrimidine kinase/phosphomethylpyrimidine kinase [Pirellulales bacterium]|nr:bifunctional hydroxymethylpyrimidine kinase/phosphomethylpyrimidine kinase [Pirellulales bacterium]
MIIVAGLSPAWQQVLVVDAFQPGAVNRASEAYWCGSGKVLNVAVALHHLSGGAAGQTLTLSTLGGPAYDAIENEFSAMGVPRRWVRTQSPTRVCTTVVDRATRVATELVENASPITDAELSEFESAFAEVAADATVVVLTGSLPSGVPPDFFRRLLASARGQAVLDLRGPELLAALDARPLLVKPNREELSHTLGASLHNDDQFHLAIAELQRRGAQAVVVTSGKNEVRANVDGQPLRFTPRPVKDAVNPIGCGDCLTAGIAWALHQGKDVTTAVKQGMKCARDNLLTLIPSDFNREREFRNRR